MAIRFRTRQLKRADFPTLGRPTIATVGKSAIGPHWCPVPEIRVNHSIGHSRDSDSERAYGNGGHQVFALKGVGRFVRLRPAVKRPWLEPFLAFSEARDQCPAVEFYSRGHR